MAHCCGEEYHYADCPMITDRLNPPEPREVSDYEQQDIDRLEEAINDILMDDDEATYDEVYANLTNPERVY